MDDNFLDKTAIESFRFDLTWRYMDEFIADSAHVSGWSELADSIIAAYPDDEHVEKMFMFKFEHRYKMDIPPGHDSNLVYKYHDDYEDDFVEMCRFIGDSLGARGLHTYVIHNEPNRNWHYLYGPPDSSGGPNWMGTAKEYAEQCSTCIKEIRDGDSLAYIIFGSFAGHNTMGVDTVGAIAAMTDSMNLDMVDCIDFHVYMDSCPAPKGVQIAQKIKAFCQNKDRNEDWSVLETCGPKLQFPTDSIPEGETRKIVQMLRDFVSDNQSGWLHDDSTEYYQELLIDSLYTLTRLFDPCLRKLPEHWFYDRNDECLYNLEDYKILEFDRRVAVFDSAGAEFTHWFSAWRYRPYHYSTITDWGCYDPECQEPMPFDPLARATKLIKQAKYFPRNILDPEDTTWQTPFAEHIQDYIYTNPWHNRVSGGRPTDEYFVNSGEMWLSNYPNTFNARTNIKFGLPQAGHTKLEVFNILGKRVEVLVNGKREAGNYSVTWDAKKHPSGIYFCRLVQGSMKTTKKLALVK